MPIQVGVEIVDGKQPEKSRTKPKLAIRGTRRRTVRKLLHYLELTLIQDQRESVRAASLKYEPYLSLSSLTGANKSALDRLVTLMQKNLGARI